MGLYPSKTERRVLDSQVGVGEIVFCTFFFVHRSLFFEPRPLPPYQAVKGRDRYVKEVKMSMSVLGRSDLQRSHIIVSHRWLTEAHPDPDGTQRDAIKVWLTTNSEVEWVWLDFCCLPQETEEFKRSGEEKTYFRAALNFSNTLYLSLPVLVIADVEYTKRFWCLLEVFLAFRTFEDGRITTAQGGAEHMHIICDEVEVATSLEQDWKTGTVEEALSRLLEDRIMVTSQSDKLLQVARLKFLEPMLCHLRDFEMMRLAHTSVGAADSLAAATSLQALGYMREELQDVGCGWDEALVCYRKSEQAYLAAGATSSADYAGLLKSMGANLTKRGQYEDGMSYYRKSEQAYLAAGATSSADYAGLLMSMGANLTKRGQYEDGMSYYRKSEQAYLAAGATSSADYASLLMSMGVNLAYRDQYEDGMSYSKKSEQAYLAAGATSSADYAGLLMSMGTNLTNRGQYEDGMSYYRKSEQAYLAAGATSSADYAGLLMCMGVNLTERGQYEDGMSYYRKSEQAYMAAGVAHHPGLAALRSQLRGSRT